MLILVPGQGVASSKHIVVIVPGDIQIRTGGYGYDREIMAGLARLGWDVQLCALDDSFPFPCDEARASAGRSLAALPDDALVLADGLAFGAMAEEAERESSRLRFVALVHHPLALESGLDPAAARMLFESERRALQTARGVIVTSPATARSLEPYGVPADRIAIVPPGTAPAPAARGTRGVAPPHREIPLEMLCVASLTPRKGYDVLFRAVSRLLHRPWHLTCAGSPDLDPETAAALAEQVRADGLDTRVTFVGELDERAMAAAYDRTDVFVLPTRHEGYGMAVSEAVARGLPVVSTPTGAIPDLVDASSGLLVPVDDVEALSDALDALIDDETRARLTAGARRRRQRLPTWSDAALGIAAAVTQFAAHGIVQR
jgi:glycosyltransferase involved in cell wall biosynthesis